MKFNPIDILINQHIIRIDADVPVWCIGDVHGCADEYEILIEAIKAQNPNAIIIQLGDMIDRGPHFDKMLFDDKSDYRVMGNHEYNFILEQMGLVPCRSKSRALNHQKLIDLPDDDQRKLMKLLKSRKSHYVLDTVDRRYVFSHAPIKNIELYDFEHAFGTMNIASYCMGSIPVNMEAFATVKKPVTYIHGHQSWSYTDIREQVNAQSGNMAKVFNLDSGCVYGKQLIAFNIFDTSVISVESSVAVPHGN